MPKNNTRSAADVASLVDRLPGHVSMENIHLASAETERRRKLLARRPGIIDLHEKDTELAGQMALAQAYERIEHLEHRLAKSKREGGGS